MREIGIVSRFAPPAKKGQENVFAFIERSERKSKPEIRVYPRQLRGSVDGFIQCLLFFSQSFNTFPFLRHSILLILLTTFDVKHCGFILRIYL